MHFWFGCLRIDQYGSGLVECLYKTVFSHIGQLIQCALIDQIRRFGIENKECILVFRFNDVYGYCGKLLIRIFNCLMAGKIQISDTGIGEHLFRVISIIREPVCNGYFRFLPIIQLCCCCPREPHFLPWRSNQLDDRCKIPDRDDFMHRLHDINRTPYGKLYPACLPIHHKVPFVLVICGINAVPFYRDILLFSAWVTDWYRLRQNRNLPCRCWYGNSFHRPFVNIA